MTVLLIWSRDHDIIAVAYFLWKLKGSSWRRIANQSQCRKCSNSQSLYRKNVTCVRACRAWYTVYCTYFLASGWLISNRAVERGRYCDNPRRPQDPKWENRPPRPKHEDRGANFRQQMTALKLFVLSFIKTNRDWSQFPSPTSYSSVTPYHMDDMFIFTNVY